MADLITILVILAIVGGAIMYIIREKKRGAKCIGCPAGTTCPNSGKCLGNCGGHSEYERSCHIDTEE